MTCESENVRAVLVALLDKMNQIEAQGEQTDRFTARDIGYFLTGLNGMQRYLYPEVDSLLEAFYLQVSKTEFGGLPNVQFYQFGKGFRIKIGTSSPTESTILP